MSGPSRGGGGPPADDEEDAAPGRADVQQRIEVSRRHKGLSLLDVLDAELGPLDRRAVLAAARAGRLLLNGTPAGPGETLRLGDQLELGVDPGALRRTASRELPVLHRGEDWLVASKPSGLPFDEGRRGGASALALIGPRRGQAAARPRPVHRLDRDTSGVVVVAFGQAAEDRLAAQVESGHAHVEYVAIVRNAPVDDRGTFDAPLGKARRGENRLIPDPDHGEPARTDFAVEERLRGFALLRLRPQGGRSHQVRAHLAAAGHPALCDALYREDDRLLLSQLKLDYRAKRGRPERPLLQRPAVHAERFVLDGLVVVAPLPGELATVLAHLRRLRPLARGAC